MSDTDRIVSGAWVEVDSTPAVAANQFLSQIAGPDEIVLSFGHVAPPLFHVSQDARTERSRRVDHLAIRPIGRYAMTRARLVELRAVLDETLRNHDAAVRDAYGDGR